MLNASYLKNVLKNPLHGMESHKKMCTQNRDDLLKTNPLSEPTQSAVLILIYNKDNEPFICFIKRTHDGNHHSGQIAFPGGKTEISDTDLYHTALREANEEIGINPEEVSFCGELSPLLIPISNFIVYPFVGYCENTPHFNINKVEVDSLIEIPIAYLQSHEAFTNFSLPYNNSNIQIPCFHYQGHTVWGATAMMLMELLDMVNVK